MAKLFEFPRKMVLLRLKSLLVLPDNCKVLDSTPAAVF
jgi:hypothetical protein